MSVEVVLYDGPRSGEVVTVLEAREILRIPALASLVPWRDAADDEVFEERWPVSVYRRGYGPCARDCVGRWRYVYVGEEPT